MARKRTDIVPLTLRIREELRHRLERTAKKNDTSINAEIQRRLDSSYQSDAEKVRLPDELRWSLESEAASRGHSINREIVRRLHESFLAQDEKTKLIARTLLSGLDDAIVNEMVDTVMRDRAIDQMADDAREEEQIERWKEGKGND